MTRRPEEGDKRLTRHDEARADSDGRPAPTDRPGVLPEKLRLFEEYWHSIADPRLGIPYRRDFDIAAVAPLVSNLSLVDIVAVDDGPPRYRFRLAGTWYRENFGVELTGRYIDEYRSGEALAVINRTYAHIAESRTLHYWRHRSMIEGREHMTYARLMGALAEDDGRVIQLVGCFVRA